MFERFLFRLTGKAPGESSVAHRLQKHFSAPLTDLHIVAEQFELCEHANVQLAINAFCDQRGRSAELLGIAARFTHGSPSLSRLGIGVGGDSAVAAPVRYASVKLADGQQLPCVESGVYLIDARPQRLAMLVCRVDVGLQHMLILEVMSPNRDAADHFLSDLRSAMQAHHVYRGKVISLSADALGHNFQVQFHRLPDMTRERIILPSGLLERIERQSLGFAKHRDALAAAGRHLKRGILLHGPPGTGKTLTAMYLAKQMPERTTILVMGQATKLPADQNGSQPRANAVRARSLAVELLYAPLKSVLSRSERRRLRCNPA